MDESLIKCKHETIDLMITFKYNPEGDKAHAELSWSPTITISFSILSTF